MKFPHPDYLLALLTWSQFTDWVDYYEIKNGDETGGTINRPIDMKASLALLDRMKQGQQAV